MIRCKQVARLLTSDQLAEQIWMKRVEVKLHLWMCKYCSRLAKQIHQLKAAVQRVFGEPMEELGSPAGQNLEKRVLAKLSEKPSAED